AGRVFWGRRGARGRGGYGRARAARWRVGGRHRRRRSRRVERGLPQPPHAVARVLDQVVTHHRRLDERLDVTGPEGWPRHLPERTAIVAAYSDTPEESRQDGYGHPDVFPRRALCVRRVVQTSRVGVRDLMGEAG